MAAARGDHGLLERADSRILIGALVGFLAVTAIGVAWYFGARSDHPGAGVVPGDAGPALTVEVLNATDIDGLARNVARDLRRRGIDVVYFGSAAERGRDSTLLLVRRGDSTAARAVRRALGVGRMVVELDPDRLLDVTVLVGRDAAALDRDP